ncbi:DUF6350 family protein [Marmoricola sp. OAE513]|uniref:cell division protein PerM n=1 Tax=Marmoricola sp. OAE513 TaxID=2817894 RepID=UPI001AE50B90
MSDLTIRLPRGSGSGEGSGRSLSTSAAIGGAVAGLVTLVVCMAVALTAWFLADAGAHGETTDALRAGADGWLVGHGSRFVLNGMPLGIVPLTVTMLLVLGAFRGGRWAAGRAEEPEGDRALGLAVAAFVGSYVVLAVVVCVAASRTGAEPELGRSILGALLVSALGGGAGLAAGTGYLGYWVLRLPEWLREMVAGAVAGALALLAAGAVLVVVSLGLSFNEAANVLTSLDLSSGDAVTLVLVTSLFAPNAALFGSAYLIGPGFAVGTIASGVTTSVSPAAPVVLGAVPAVPLLAALPEEGPTPGWLIGVCAVPLLAAGLGVWKAGRATAPLPYDLAAIRGAGAGFGSAVLVTVAIGLSGGPMGVDRLAKIGAPVGETFVFALASMVIGGVFAALVQSFLQRRNAVA